MLGSTQMVDMETIRKNDFGRIQVAVLNPNHIPAHLDIVIGDHYFELEFEVEKIGVDENRYEMEVGWVGGDDDGEGNEEKRFKNDGSESRDPKRQKNSGKVEQEGEKEHEREGEYTENIGQNCSLSLGSVAFLEKVNNMSEEVFEAFLRKKADAILDGVVSKIVGEIADKVIAEQNEVMVKKEEEWSEPDSGAELEEENNLPSESQEPPQYSSEIEQTVVSTRGSQEKNLMEVRSLNSKILKKWKK